MFVKITMASAILALSSSIACAAGAPYVGLNLGGLGLTDQFTDSTGFTTRLASKAAQGGLFAGYGGNVNRYIYLSGEVFGNLATNGSEVMSGETVQNISNYGIDFIPGLRLNDLTLAYLKLGIQEGRISDSGPATGPAAPSFTTQNLFGYQAGAGVRVSITQYFDVRAEYVYNQYNDISDNVPGSLGGHDRIYTDQFDVGLVYKFY
jgi:opacity protein-like surface antigen